HLFFCIAAAAVLLGRAQSPTRGDTLAVLPIGDTANVCPAGFKRGLFLQLFRLSPAAAQRLFPKPDPRTVTVAAGPSLRRRLAVLANVDTSQIQGGAWIAAFF